MEGPRWSPDLLDLRRERKHSINPPSTPSRGVCAGIPAWTGGRHFLGMANPVPQPNQGSAQGCNCQGLQESRQASGMESAPPPIPGHRFPDTSGKWLPSAFGGEGLIHRHPKDNLCIFTPSGQQKHIVLFLTMLLCPHPRIQKSPHFHRDAPSFLMMEQSFLQALEGCWDSRDEALTSWPHTGLSLHLSLLPHLN